MKHRGVQCAVALAAGLWVSLSAAAGAGEAPAELRSSEPASARAAVLELTGQAEVAAPDIVFLALRPSEGVKGYRKVFKQLGEAGTTLEHTALTVEDFVARGPLQVLAAARYRVLPVRDLAWAEACALIQALLELRRQLRVEEGVAQVPLCVVLNEEASAQDVAETLPGLVDAGAMVFLAPQEKGLPLLLFWRNVVWPDHVVVRQVAPDHWVPTLAEVVGLPPPADVAEVSVLPTLTGVGYQRPLEAPEGRRAAGDERQKPSTMFCLFRELPAACPWVPDYTSERTELKPSERAFFPVTLPLPARAAAEFSRTEKPMGLYVRTQQRACELVLPAGVACVIRVNGLPVLSRRAEEPEETWRIEGPEAQALELFFVLPAGFALGDLRGVFAEEAPETAE